MTPSLRRMNEDMKLFGYSKRTQETYLYAVSRLSRFFDKSPDQISDEELREYLLQHKDRYAPNTTTIAVCGIKFFYRKTLNRKMPVLDLVRQPRGNKLPVVLTREEVHAILANVRVLRHRACLTLIYSCGLRLGEATTIKVNQIDSQRMVVHIQDAKGSNDRYVPLPVTTLQILREHYRTHRNPVWVFPAPGRGGSNESASMESIPVSSVQQVFRKRMLAAGIRKDAHVRTLRHSYATHLLEAGVDIRIISEYLGHKNLESTLIYTHMTPLMNQGVAQNIHELMRPLAALTRM